MKWNKLQAVKVQFLKTCPSRFSLVVKSIWISETTEFSKVIARYNKPVLLLTVQFSNKTLI